MLSINYAIEYSTDVDFETFKSDKMRYFAIVKNVETIGEAANMLTKDFLEDHPTIPWSDIIAMRNVLVHDYYNISDSKLWATVKEDVPYLKAIVSQLLEETDWEQWVKNNE